MSEPRINEAHDELAQIREIAEKLPREYVLEMLLREITRRFKIAAQALQELAPTSPRAEQALAEINGDSVVE